MLEYTGPKNPETIIVAMGSIVGTIKEALKENKKTGILKIKTYRPFPHQEVLDIIKTSKKVAVLEKAVSFGTFGPLYSDISIKNKKQEIKNFIGGLGGRDINSQDINKIINNFNKYKDSNFI